MNSTLHRRALALRALPALLLLLGLAACESDRPSRRGPPSAETGAAAPAPFPDMETHGTFFAGQIEVEVLVNRAGFGPRDAGSGATPSSGSSGGGRGGFSGGFGGGGGRRGGGGGGGGRGGSGRGGGEQAAGGARPSDDGTPAIHIPVSNLPPVRLHLRLTNHGTDPVEVEVPDFDSDLGNFVVQPPKILLPPNQAVETDPMISRLGVNAAEIALTVAIRANGKVEKQVLVLRLVPPAPPPPAGSAASPPTTSP